MSPVTHGLISWLIANTPGTDRRGRIAITIAGIAPDIDGIGYPFEALTMSSEHPLHWFHDYHHHLTRNLVACVAIAGFAWLYAKRQWRVALLAFSASVLHLLCDVIGARGPDGDPWVVPFFQPFSDWTWAWAGEWELASWQNGVITVVALIIATMLAVRRGFSPVELVSPTADAAVVRVLRSRFRPTSTSDKP